MGRTAEQRTSGPSHAAEVSDGAEASGGDVSGAERNGAGAGSAGDASTDDAPDPGGNESSGERSDDTEASAPSGNDHDEPEAPRGPLPDGVRQRVIALAADGLGAMTPDEIPVPLRQFARFTPSRRAKLAATPLAGALENDPVFRQRIAERLRRGLPDLAAALEAGRPPAAADPLDVAAAAYLLRPRGWTELLDIAGQAAEKAAQDRAGAEAAAVVDRLEAELGALRASARAEQERLRADLDQARKEAEQLRRQVRGLQGGAKHAEKEAKRAQAELAAVRSEAQAAIAAADKEARRLRSRVSEAESALEASRRAAREGRSMEDTRVRLLLDTVLEAAQGLRRELALPPVGMRPADTVDAVAPEGASPKDIAKRALEGDDPAVLDQLLSLPQAHLVIDGYNVTKTGYPSLALSEQRVRLLGGLAVIAAQTGCEITCVFDGAQLDAPVLLAPPRGVRVRFSKAGETADELIRRLVRAEPLGRPVIVVSSDREVADGVRRAGARPVPSTMLLRRLARG
ncbi:MAG TPA: NYN domain-containing protein [Yinghuangia sp.]|nr:NYN domain-containing protein [Yinghuangia sp.]